MTKKYVCPSIVLIIITAMWGCRNSPGVAELSNAGFLSVQLDLCDDVNAFKSNVDLEQLEYLKTCYVCTAVKSVPGLGEVSWTGNCYAYLADSTLELRFGTYEPFFEELLLRESVALSVPIRNGIQTLHSFDEWEQNHSLAFAFYSRLLDDGDVFDAGWTADPSCYSFINIKRLDLEDREVEGEFELHLKILTQGSNGILYSERINFIAAKFITDIKH